MIKKYEKKNGTTAYMFKAYLGVDSTTGKKKYTTKRGFKTLREANLLQVKVQEKDVLTDWLEQYRNTVKESTYVAQRLALEKHILPIFGDLKVSKISIPYCQKQVNHCYSYCKKFLNFFYP